MSHFYICVNSKKGANMDYLFHIVPVVAVGLQITLKIFIITIVLSLALGHPHGYRPYFQDRHPA